MSAMGCISTNQKRADSSPLLFYLADCMQGDSQVPFEGLQAEIDESCLHVLHNAGVRGLPMRERSRAGI